MSCLGWKPHWPCWQNLAYGCRNGTTPFSPSSVTCEVMLRSSKLKCTTNQGGGGFWSWPECCRRKPIGIRYCLKPLPRVLSIEVPIQLSTLVSTASSTESVHVLRDTAHPSVPYSAQLATISAVTDRPSHNSESRRSSESLS